MKIPRFITSQTFPRAAVTPVIKSFSKMASTAAFLETVKNRRTYYQINNETTIPDSRLQEIVKHTILHAPSAFNSQASRIVVLLKKEHEKLWNIALDVLKSQLPEDKFKYTEQRLKGFRAGYGTILFYEDNASIREFQTKFKAFEDKFPTWAEQSSGMHQYILWTALEAEGLGCNLQHYNPLIDAPIANEWKISPDWSLKGQLVFGKPTGEPNQKTFRPVEERVAFHGE